MKRGVAVAMVLALVLVACGPSGPVATVDGVEVTSAELAALNTGSGIDARERASSLFLLILHRLLVEAAQKDFGYSVPGADLRAAFDKRTDGLGDDVDGRLAARGETRARVLLESELDVLRSHLEGEMVRADGYGFDFDKAYRGFLGANSKVCMVVLTLADRGLVDEIQRRIDGGEDLDAVFEQYPDRTARLDMGCRSPLDHGQELAPVALDGEIGRSYVRPSGDGAIYVAKVTERDAPSVNDVRDQVIAYGVESQGPELFDAWAVSILKSADVSVAESVGRWAPGPETGDVPTVVAP
jgi:hypothetical protein